MKIRLKYPEHTSYCVGFEEELDENGNDKDEDEDDDDDDESETSDESDNHSKKQKLFIFYSIMNKKEKHMMPKVIHSKLNLKQIKNKCKRLFFIFFLLFIEEWLECKLYQSSQRLPYHN